MAYIPHTDADVAEMLATIGVASIDELFREIPENLRIAPGSLNLPSARDEHSLIAYMRELALKNSNLMDNACFLGAGIYDRYIPASVGAVLSRGEFLTAYTPYQPEASQGYLQTIYEYQSMVAEVYGMDLANASMYDGGTSMAEAAIMATGVNHRLKVAVSEAIHPHYRQVLRTYCLPMGIEVIEIPQNNGHTEDYSAAAGAACVIVGYPNFFGIVEDLAEARKVSTADGSLLIVVADPVACALLTPPGKFGADVVVGEGQSFGVPMGLGGPLVGHFACKKEHVRRIPGRIVGRTTEAHGDRTGYVMTLRTREQDIRREKATSNICTNEALMALANAVYLSALGRNGLRKVAEDTVRNTQYAITKLTQAGGRVKFAGPVFQEFVLELPVDAAVVRDALLQKKILAGLPLGPYYPWLANSLLVACTELRKADQIDAFADALREVLA